MSHASTQNLLSSRDSTPEIHGVNHKGAFAPDAAVEDPHKFSTASKLSTYGGFSTIADSSGEEEGYAKDMLMHSEKSISAIAKTPVSLLQATSVAYF